MGDHCDRLGRVRDVVRRVEKSSVSRSYAQDAEEVTFDFTDNENDTGVRFALNHPDLDRLREASAVVQEQLATYAAAYDIGDNLTAAADEIRIETIDPGAGGKVKSSTRMQIKAVVE